MLDTYAQALLKRGESAAALERLREAHTLAKSDVTIQLHLAQALIANNQSGEARRILERLSGAQTPAAQRQQAQALLKAIR